jgi:hypothetical protein
MRIYEIDPTTDERWEGLLEDHPQASIFHTGGWLEALRRTYDYTPVAFTTSPPSDPLTNGIPFCKINGFLGKRRLVSLPFSDHCEPLVEYREQLRCLLAYLQQKHASEGWDYIELRPRTSELGLANGFGQSQAFFFHQLDLKRELDEILLGIHKDCILRKLRRATREGLVCEQGTSDSLLQQFYQLLIMTRQRHGVPTQPIEWFRNLIACLEKKVTIRVASKDGVAIASILTLRYKDALVYKYGCSDRKFNSLGGMQLLIWRAIQDAKGEHLREFDLGRSDRDNPGLITFKDRWSATRAELAYFRSPLRHSHHISIGKQSRLSKYVWSHVPIGIGVAAGRALYKYMG